MNPDCVDDAEDTGLVRCGQAPVTVEVVDEMPEELLGLYRPLEEVAYEDGTEFNEGLAKYIEWRLVEVLEGRSPGPAMDWVRGFHGYADLSEAREQLIQGMVASLTGEQIVNNDPYGDGWLYEIVPSDETELDDLLDAAAYEETLED